RRGEVDGETNWLVWVFSLVGVGGGGEFGEKGKSSRVGKSSAVVIGEREIVGSGGNLCLRKRSAWDQGNHFHDPSRK
ncbi:hypothetical protein LINPERPRIM_LOCUS11038, partial [Linum perenne]